MNFSEMINGIGSPNRPEYEVYTSQGLLFTTPSRKRAFEAFLDYQERGIWSKVMCGTAEVATCEFTK